MKMKMYFNSDDKNIIDKNIVSIGSAVTVKFKDDTNLLNPTLIVRASEFDNLTNYVYVYASSQEDVYINRYYYIDDVVFSQTCVELHCSVDVLMSHQKFITDQRVTFKRAEQSSKINLYLNDPEFVLENRTRYQTVPFKKGFVANFNDGKGAYPILTLNGSGAVN